MLLNDRNDIDIVSDVEDDGTDFSIDVESMGILFKGFSDNLYSNKIGSIVREIASNCVDAHVEAGQDRPFEIIMTDTIFEGEMGNITFKDYGPGLSPERIKNVYSKYFSSTKRSGNDQIGGLSIGNIAQ